jgi:hypothetical protein
MGRYLRLLLIVCAALGCVAAPAEGQPGGSRRTVRIFDFEELNNPDPVPAGWIRIDDRSDFPVYNKAAFDRRDATDGERSVRIPTLGLNAGLKLPGGIIPAIPGGDYVVAAWIRTTELNHARARMDAIFHDAADQPIDASRASTALVATRGEWQLHYLELQGDYPDAAYISIELLLLQPDAFTDDPRNEHQARLQDVKGTAWFDDVAVYQAPRVSMQTSSPLNVVVAPAQPEVRLLVRDLTGEHLNAVLDTYDVFGRQVASQTLPIPRSGRERSFPIEVTKYGWYRSVLSVQNETETVGLADLEWAYLSPTTKPTAEALRFGVIAEDLPRRDLRELPDLMRELDVGSVWLSVWDGSLELEGVPNLLSGHEPVVDQLLLDRREVTLTLRRIPHELARQARVDDNNLMGLLRSDPSVYLDYLDPVLVKFGQQVRRWQLGATGDQEAFFQTDIAQIVRVLSDAAQRYVPGPIIVLPWSIEQSPRPEIEAGSGWTVATHWSLPPDALAKHVLQWSDQSESTFVLELPDPEKFSVGEGVAAVAKQAIIAWSVGAPGLAIQRPWQIAGDVRRQITPTPIFPAWRELGRRLGGRRVVTTLPIAAGIRALVIAESGEDVQTGAIVLWNEAAPAERAELRMHLGDGPIRIVDLYGNERDAAVERGVHVVPIPDEPIFVEGVNLPLAIFRANFRVQPDFIVSAYDLHHHHLEIYNPWPVTISGELRMVKPESWEYRPRYRQFSIPSGERLRFPFTLTYPPSEPAGWRQIVTDVTLFSDHPYRVRMTQDIEVGLKTVKMTPSFEVDEDDLIVLLQITNTSLETTSYRAYIAHSAFGRQQRPVGALEPAERRIIYFRLEGMAEQLGGAKIRAGLIEVDGPARLNKQLHVP